MHVDLAAQCPEVDRLGDTDLSTLSSAELLLAKAKRKKIPRLGRDRRRNDAFGLVGQHGPKGDFRVTKTGPITTST